MYGGLDFPAAAERKRLLSRSLRPGLPFTIPTYVIAGA
jgi:hypothetical protein